MWKTVCYKQVSFKWLYIVVINHSVIYIKWLFAVSFQRELCDWLARHLMWVRDWCWFVLSVLLEINITVKSKRSKNRADYCGLTLGNSMCSHSCMTTQRWCFQITWLTWPITGLQWHIFCLRQLIKVIKVVCDRCSAEQRPRGTVMTSEDCVDCLSSMQMISQPWGLDLRVLRPASWAGNPLTQSVHLHFTSTVHYTVFFSARTKESCPLKMFFPSPKGNLSNKDIFVYLMGRNNRKRLLKVNH